jgi:hypothetical protein
MDYTSNPSGPPSNEHPNAHDYAQLDTICTHLDSFNTTIALGAGTLAGDSRASWGTLVRGEAGQGVNLYVRDFGNGNRTVTFVTWA